jgi:hypothetical protein
VRSIFEAKQLDFEHHCCHKEDQAFLDVGVAMWRQVEDKILANIESGLIAKKILSSYNSTSNI